MAAVGEGSTTAMVDTGTSPSGFVSVAVPEAGTGDPGSAAEGAEVNPSGSVAESGVMPPHRPVRGSVGLALAGGSPPALPQESAGPCGLAGSASTGSADPLPPPQPRSIGSVPQPPVMEGSSSVTVGPSAMMEEPRSSPMSDQARLFGQPGIAFPMLPDAVVVRGLRQELQRARRSLEHLDTAIGQAYVLGFSVDGGAGALYQLMSRRVPEFEVTSDACV
jgi:hypothetical protein